MRRAFGCVVVVILSTLVFAFVGMWLVELLFSGALNPWRRDSLPGGLKAESFLPHEGPDAIVRTTDGRLFLQDLNQYEALAWREVESLPSVTESGRGVCRVIPLNEKVRGAARQPRSAVDKLHCWYSVHPEHGIDFVYVILENGGIQRWERHEPGLASVGALFYYPILAGIVGAIFGLILFFVLIWLLDRGKPKAEVLEIETVSLIDE